MLTTCTLLVTDMDGCPLELEVGEIQRSGATELFPLLQKSENPTVNAKMSHGELICLVNLVVNYTAFCLAYG